MSTKSILWLTAAAALILAVVPTGASAEGGPPPRPTQIRFEPPVITGVNLHADGPEGYEGEFTLSGPAAAGGSFPVLPEAPGYLPPLSTTLSTPAAASGTAAAADVGCGPRALAGVLQSLEGEGAPTGGQLLAELRARGLLYAWGTGVEELAYLARRHGFRGSVPFHEASLPELEEWVRQGVPVIVALGENGKGSPGHFVTMTSVSADGAWFWVDDPTLGRRLISREALAGSWAAQGSAGLRISRENVTSGRDPLLPWIGLLGAVSALTVLAGSSSFSRQNRQILEKLRALLSSRTRKGIGGSLEQAAVPGSWSSPIGADPRILLGWREIKKEVPVYAWRKVRTGSRQVTVEEPVYTRLKVRVGTETRVRKEPVYITKKIQVGTRPVRKMIRVQGKKRRVVTSWKKVIRRVPVYKRFGWTRIRVGTRQEVTWKKVRKVKWVPCTYLKMVTRQEPVYEEIQVQQGWKEVSEEVPVYERHRVQSGTRQVVRSVPVYEDKRFRVGTRTVTEQVPVYAGDPEETSPQPQTTVEYLKSLDTAREGPAPLTTVEYLKEKDEHYDGTFTNPPVPAIAADYFKIKEIPKSLEAATNKESWWEKAFHDINQKYIKPIKHYLLYPDEIVKDITYHIIPPFLSLSAGMEWKFSLSNKGEIVLNTRDLPKLLSFFYVREVIQVKEKHIVTANPKGFLNINITSGSGSVEFSKNIKYLFGPFEYGFAEKIPEPQINEKYDQIVNKYTIQFHWRGLTIKTKREGVKIDQEKTTDYLEVKRVETLKYEKHRIKTEGILAIIALSLLAYEIGLMGAGAAGLTMLEKALAGAH